MKQDVIIAGAGLAGLTLACLLGESGLSVALIESRTAVLEMNDDYDLRVSAITPASQAIFDRLGLWTQLDQRRVGRIERMRVWEQPGRVLRFDADEVGVPVLGYIIENRALTALLWRRTRTLANVAIHCPAAIRNIAWDERTVNVAIDGDTLQGRLLIGADGTGSTVRRLANMETRGWDYGQDAIVAHVRTTRPHDGTAWQRFLPTGPLAFLPMPEPDLSSIVWSCTRERAHALMALDDAAFARELHAALGDELGNLRMTSGRASFPLGTAHAREYVRPRVALLGDAAHRVHPLAGQGANLGFADAAALANIILATHAARRDVGDYTALRRYARQRKEDNLAMLAVTDGLYRLFGDAGARMLASAGLSLVDRLPWLKQSLIKRAMGIHAF